MEALSKKLFCCVGILSTVLSSIGIWLTVGILNTDSMSLVDSVIKDSRRCRRFIYGRRHDMATSHLPSPNSRFSYIRPPRAGVFLYVILI